MTVFKGYAGEVKLDAVHVAQVSHWTIATRRDVSEDTKVGSDWRRYKAILKEFDVEVHGYIDMGDATQRAIIDEIISSAEDGYIAALSLDVGVGDRLDVDATLTNVTVVHEGPDGVLELILKFTRGTLVQPIVRIYQAIAQVEYRVDQAQIHQAQAQIAHTDIYAHTRQAVVQVEFRDDSYSSSSSFSCASSFSSYSSLSCASSWSSESSCESSKSCCSCSSSSASDCSKSSSSLFSASPWGPRSSSSSSSSSCSSSSYSSSSISVSISQCSKSSPSSESLQSKSSSSECSCSCCSCSSSWSSYSCSSSMSVSPWPLDWSSEPGSYSSSESQISVSPWGPHSSSSSHSYSSKSSMSSFSSYSSMSSMSSFSSTSSLSCESSLSSWCSTSSYSSMSSSPSSYSSQSSESVCSASSLSSTSSESLLSSPSSTSSMSSQSCESSESSPCDCSKSSESSFSSVSSSESMCWRNDYFSAASVSETPDPGTWRIVESYAAGTPYITSGDKLHLIQGSTATGPYDLVETRFVLTDEFDVQVDWTGVSQPAGSTWYWDMGAQDVGLGCTVAHIRYGFGFIGFSQKYKSRFLYRTDCGDWSYDEEDRGFTRQNNGKLRLKRVWNVDHYDWTAYIWTGSAWEQIGSEHTCTSGNIAIQLRAVNGASWPSGGWPYCSWDADNFKITIGCEDTSEYSYSWSSASSESSASDCSKSSESSYSSESSSWSQCYLNDDFTGTTSDAPDPDLWNIYSGSPYIQNNKLRLSKVGGGAGDGVITRAIFYGDFDVQIDFQRVSYSEQNQFGYDLRIYFQTAGCDMAVCRWGYWSTEYSYTYLYRSSCVSGWSYHDEQTAGAIDGKLRIKRSGSNVSAYGWKSGAWDQIGSTQDLGNTGSVKVRLYAHNDGLVPTSRWLADNFVVTDGCLNASLSSTSSESSESVEI